MGIELVNQSEEKKALILPEYPDSLTNYHLILSGLFKSFIMVFKAPGKKLICSKQNVLQNLSVLVKPSKHCSLSSNLTQFHDSSSKNPSSSCLIDHHAVRDPIALSRAMHFANCFGDGKLCSF